MDFFGTNSTTPKLRHAYGQAKNFLVGQTFSNFMDPDAGADTLDDQGPNGHGLYPQPSVPLQPACGKQDHLQLFCREADFGRTFYDPGV